MTNPTLIPVNGGSLPPDAMRTDTMLWTNSGDSHFIEPPDLYQTNLPKSLADRLPRSEKISDEEEIVHIDGRELRRRLPKPSPEMVERLRDFREAFSQADDGARNGSVRLGYLDEQGVWGEVVFPSLGLWYGEIESADLVIAAARVLNDYVHNELIRTSPRFVPTATLPLQSIEASLREAERVIDLAFRAIFLPMAPPKGLPFWNDDIWEPLWALCEESSTVPAFHIGTDPADRRKYKNPGGALLNYVDTSFGGQACGVALVASGVLDRHPGLKVLVSEGGATWAPFVGDRMNECHRQQPMWDEGRLRKLPKAYVMEQVYASFQHDETAIPTMTAMGYRNVMFGSDFPHLEGTYPDTQKVLHDLFDGVDSAVSERVRFGSFLDLFPEVGRPHLERPTETT